MHLEQIAADLVAAYDADAPALARLGRHYGRALTHDDVRAAVWDRVYEVRQRFGRGEGLRLEVAEARAMLARDAGFGDWSAYVEAAGRPAPGSPFQLDEQAIAPRRTLTGAEWDALLDLVREHRITTLRANGQMTDALLGRVAELEHVTHLELDGSRQLTDAGLQQLARMPQLLSLDLSGCVVSDDALAVLRSLPRLRRFRMSWRSAITDAGAAHLAACEELESVDLMGTQTGDGAIRALAGKPHLRRLRTGRLVTDAGLPLLQQFPRFRTWSGGEMKISLMDSEPEPTFLLLDGPFTDVAALAGLDGLFALNFFWHTSALTPASLAPLAQLPHLGFLAIEGTLCDDTAMRTLGALPQLRMLVAQGTVATDDGFASLARSRSLEYLWTREAPHLAGRGFAALANIPTLRGLGVSCQNVDDAALATLPSFPALRELMPMDVRDDGFRHVGRCAQLEILWCMYCRETTDAATEHLRDLRLQSYYAGKTRITDASLAILANMDSLERIQFWETAGVTAAGVRLLRRLPHLRELGLEGLPHVTADVAAEFPARVRVSYAP